MKLTTHPSSAEEFAPYKEKWDTTGELLGKLPFEERRGAFSQAPLALPENAPVAGDDVEITHRMVAVRDGTEIELRIYRGLKVESSARSALFLRIHGGGWVQGGHNIEDPENRYLATIPNLVVVSVDYRLAPEFKFPHGLNDCFDVLQWCKTNATTLGIDPERIIVGGSSAGGNLSAALVLMAQSHGTETSGIIGQVLNFPATCYYQNFPSEKYKLTSFEENAFGSIVSKADMIFFWDSYISPEEGTNIFVSPLLASRELLSKAPKTFMVACGGDSLRDECIAYGQALDEAGVDVQVDEYPGLPHGFVLETGVKSVGIYYERVVEFVRSVVDEA